MRCKLKISKTKYDFLLKKQPKKDGILYFHTQIKLKDVEMKLKTAVDVVQPSKIMKQTNSAKIYAGWEKTRKIRNR